MHIKILIIFDDMTDESQSSDVIFMKNGFDKLQIYRYQLKKKIVLSIPSGPLFTYRCNRTTFFS